MMGLKAVGLISGGKDSIFAIYYARELGHDICAVATLLPTEGTTESDSFMYQSIGTGITAAIAECMDIPHYTRVVEGKPICTETLHYKKTEGDEVEDLFNLLSHVKVCKGMLAASMKKTFLVFFFFLHSFLYCRSLALSNS